MNQTNTTTASTALPGVTIRKINDIATALSADSQQPLEIKPFIDGVFEVLASEASSSIKHSATSAVRHGFSASANSRFAAFLEDFRSNPRLVERYREDYPNCVFLPWKGIHRLLAVLDLWFEQPQHYVGAVPESQLPWMDLFEWADKDRDEPTVSDWQDLITPEHRQDRSNGGEYRRGFIQGCWGGHFPHEVQRNINYARIEYGEKIEATREGMKAFREGFFVLAPKEAFNTEDSFIKRMQDAAKPVVISTIAPNDPIVVRPCYGGCLCVAAWGDEAAELNKLTQTLNL